MTGTSGMTALVGGLVLVGVGFGVGYVVGGGGPAVPVTGTALDRPAASGPSVPPLAKLEGAPVPAARLESERAAAVESLRHVLDALPLPEVERGTGVITGTILTDEGAPLAGVEVSAVPSSMPDDLQRGRPPNDGDDPDVATSVRWYVEMLRWRKLARVATSTGADGRYRVEGLLDAPQGVRAKLEGWTFRANTQNTWKVRPGETVDFVASRSWSLRLDLRLPNGTQPRSATVTYRTGSGSSGMGWSPERPTWDVAPGSYEITAAAGDAQEFQSKPVTVTVPPEGPAPEVRIDLEGHPVLQGRIVWPPGERVSSARVRIVRIPAGKAADPALLASSGQDRTVYNGDAFTFADLPPGRYLVGVTRGWSGPPAATQEVEVGNGITDVDVKVPSLAPGEYVPVRILDPDGKPVSNVQITAGYRSKNRSGSSGAIAIDRPGGEKWVLTGVDDPDVEKDARYWIAVSSPAYGTKTVEYQPGATAAAEVRFEEPGKVDVEITGLAGTSYDGRARAHLGPAPGGDVQRVMSISIPDPGPDGRVTLSGIQPGDYELVLSLSYGRGSSSTIASKPLTVHSGPNRVSIAMPALYEVTIDGLDRNAYVRPKEGNQGAFRSLEGMDGRAVVDGLPAGTYTVQSGAKKSDFTVPGTSTVHL